MVKKLAASSLITTVVHFKYKKNCMHVRQLGWIRYLEILTLEKSLTSLTKKAKFGVI